MPRSYTVTEYDKEDIEKLDDMSKDDVIAVLEHIQDGWLPRDVVWSPQEYETYSQSQYESTRLYKGMSKAISMLKDMQGGD